MEDGHDFMSISIVAISFAANDPPPPTARPDPS
jgi:hypothetical protein